MSFIKKKPVKDVFPATEDLPELVMIDGFPQGDFTDSPDFVLVICHKLPVDCICGAQDFVHRGSGKCTGVAVLYSCRACQSIYVSCVDKK
jgi:hypothetical protein